nr:hypothetical protein [Hoylesella enoeca]
MMNKPLLRNIYATIAALFIAMFALPQQVQAQKSEMSMRLCGKVYYADATIPLGGGTAKWNQATTTLTITQKHLRHDSRTLHRYVCTAAAGAGAEVGNVNEALRKGVLR